MYEAFTVYRDMPDRNVSAAARATGRQIKYLCSIAKERCWQERALAWDAEIDRRIQETQLSEVEKMTRRQLQLSLGLQQAATTELRAMVRRIEWLEAKQVPGIEPRQPTTKVADIIRLIEAGAKLERLNRDKPTDIIRNENDLDLTVYTPEELKVLRDLKKKGSA